MHIQRARECICLEADRAVFRVRLTRLEHMIDSDEHGVSHCDDRGASADPWCQSFEAGLKAGALHVQKLGVKVTIESTISRGPA